MLRAWGPAGLEAARKRAIRERGDGSLEYLELVAETGGDERDAGIALAEELRASDPSDPGLAHRVVYALIDRLGGPARGGDVQFMRDERVPSWMRLIAAERSGELPQNPVTRAAVISHGRGGEMTPELVAGRIDAIDEQRRLAGLPPSPGYDVLDAHAQHKAIAERGFLVARHLDGLLAALHRDDLDEPAAAVLLELLHGARALRAQDLEWLTGQWRRLFVKPGECTPAPPAIVTLIVACAKAGHPATEQMLDAVLRDKRKWSLPMQMMLRGIFVRGADAEQELEAELLKAASGGDTGAGNAKMALALMRARSRGITPVFAACQLVLEGPQNPPYVPRGFAIAAITFAEGGTGLWHHYFRQNSPRALRTALQLALDETLPVEARRLIFGHASDSRVLDQPLRAEPVPHVDEIAELRALKERAARLLGA